MPASADGSSRSTWAHRLRGSPAANRRRWRRANSASSSSPGRLGPATESSGSGWATVDTERRSGMPRSSSTGPGAPCLGAADARGGGRVRPRSSRASAMSPSSFLEPDTEARLAAFLARFGEGLCLAYVAGEGPGGMVRPDRARCAGPPPVACAAVGAVRHHPGRAVAGATHGAVIASSISTTGKPGSSVQERSGPSGTRPGVGPHRRAGRGRSSVAAPQPRASIRAAATARERSGVAGP